MKKKKHPETLSYIEHAGYTAVQASNYHVTVYKDGRTVMHSSGTRKLTEDELRDHVDFIRGMRLRSDSL